MYVFTSMLIYNKYYHIYFEMRGHSENQSFKLTGHTIHAGKSIGVGRSAVFKAMDKEFEDEAAKLVHTSEPELLKTAFDDTQVLDHENI